MTTDSRPSIGPVRSKERYIVLDALRGFALIGICLANFPEFGLYTFLHPEAAAALPTAGADRVARWLQYILIDGKFYTLFSLLFGMASPSSFPTPCGAEPTGSAYSTAAWCCSC